MKREAFMRVIINPVTKEMGIRPVIENDIKFLPYDSDAELDRVPNIIVSRIKDTPHEINIRVDRRLEVLEAVFGSAMDSPNSCKFEWIIGDKYIRPSNELLMEVEDPLKSTFMFLMYRNWQMALGGRDHILCHYLSDKDFDSDKGYKMDHLEIAARGLRACRTLKEAARLIQTLLSLNK